MYCPNCKIDVDTNIAVCPLCGGHLEGEPLNASPYPKKQVRKKSSPVTVKGLYLMVVIPILIVCVVLNITLKHSSMWALFVTIVALYGYYSLKTTVFYKGPGGAKVFSQTFMVSILCISAQYIFNTSEWAFSYVIPSITIVALVLHILGYFIYNRQKKGKQYFRYMWLTSLVGLLPAIMLASGVCNFLYMPVISLAVSGLTLIVLLLSGGKDIADEIEKKSHI